MNTEEILELIEKMISEWDSVKTWAGICKRDALKELKAEIESRRGQYLMTEREFIIKSDSPQSIRSMEEAGYRELVRCGDCKHFEPDGIYTMCYRHNGLSQNADWFCADGERKE